MRLLTTDRKTGGRNKLLAALCGAGAMLLITAGLISGAPERAEEWIPLNNAVQASLDGMNGNASPLPSTDPQIHKGDRHEGQTGGGAVPDTAAVMPLVPDAQAGETSPLPSATPVFTSRDELGRLDLNRATVDELTELKGIGPSKAQAITDDRQRNGNFRSVDDLIRVKGIGEKLLAGIKESVVARP